MGGGLGFVEVLIRLGWYGRGDREGMGGKRVFLGGGEEGVCGCLRGKTYCL